MRTSTPFKSTGSTRPVGKAGDFTSPRRVSIDAAHLPCVDAALGGSLSFALVEFQKYSMLWVTNESNYWSGCESSDTVMHTF